MCLGLRSRPPPEKTGYTQQDRPAKNHTPKLAVASDSHEKAYHFEG